MLSDLRQVRLYLADPEVRRAARERVAAVVDDATRVLVGHSLGTVVAYEALCAHPEWPVRTLVTLGAPLGIRNLIFDRLQPPPEPSGEGLRGRWPGGVTSWVNVADAGDAVALVKDLRPAVRPAGGVLHGEQRRPRARGWPLPGRAGNRRGDHGRAW